MNEGDSLYYNIESNCLGSILMECGKGRDNRTISKEDNLQYIDLSFANKFHFFA